MVCLVLTTMAAESLDQPDQAASPPYLFRPSTPASAGSVYTGRFLRSPCITKEMASDNNAVGGHNKRSANEVGGVETV